MGYAEATYDGERILVRTVQTPGVKDFEFMLAASKKVNGGRFVIKGDGKYWSYPLSVEVCRALRRVFGERLRVGNDLADWYRANVVEAAKQEMAGAAEDAELKLVPANLADWLRGYQRAGVAWVAKGYRDAGLVADEPGLGKTPETLAALLEADVRGPVLVVCPKASVRGVWGYEARRHLPGVPVYLCARTRAHREKALSLFAKHMRQDPDRLRIVVVVAEMLRVKLGDPCFTVRIEFNEVGHEVEVPHNKIGGMCPAKRRGQECTRHIQVPPPEDSSKSAIQKWLTPVGFEYPELFNDELLHGGWSWIVLDESHKLLGSLSVVKANLMGRGLRLLPERPGRRRYALSGTPFGKGGRVQGMFGTLHWLWPDEYTSFWKWAADVLDVEEKVIGYDRYTRTQKTAKHIIGPKGMPSDATAEQEIASWDEFLSSLGPRILRRTKEEMLKNLPPKTYVEVICEMDTVQARQYKEMADFAEITTPGGPIIVNGHLALLTRSQQLANGALRQTDHEKPVFTQNSGKLDRLWEALDARGIIDGTPGDKLVIASRYNEFLDAIAIMLIGDKVPFLRLDGSVSDNKRQAIMKRWQEGLGPERVMLVNVKAGGVSINLDAADEMHIMDEDPDPGVNEQMEDRIHRASREHKVIIHYYRTEGTLDFKAAHDVEFKRKMQHLVMDGRRGIEDLRGMILEAMKE